MMRLMMMWLVRLGLQMIDAAVIISRGIVRRVIRSVSSLILVGKISLDLKENA